MQALQEKSILQEVVEDFLEDLLNKAIAEVTGVAVTFDTGYQSTTLGDGYVELWEGDFCPFFHAPMLKRGGMRPS